MNPSQASSIFIFTTLFILCAHIPLTRSMQQTRHKRHRSHAQIIHDISTGAVILNSGASARIESWNGSPGRSPRAIVFIQPVPEEAHIRQEPPVATNQHTIQAPLEQNTPPRSPSFLAQLCCCASTRKQPTRAR